MAWKVLINGVDVRDFVVTATIDLGRVNERASANLSFMPGYVPTKYHEVVITDQDGVTSLFGGVVLDRTGKGPVVLDAQAVCGDYLTYADWKFTSRTYAAPVTLKQILLDLVSDKLAVHGIAVDAAQDNGPTFDPFAWRNKRVSEALRELITRSPGRMLRMSADKKLSAFLLGATTAPFAITEADAHCTELRWHDSAFQRANKIILECGPEGTWEAHQTFVADGVATSWVTDLPAADPPPVLLAVNPTVGSDFLATITPAGLGGSYYWDRDTHTLSVGLAGTPAAGTELTLGPIASFPGNSGYTAQGPFTVERDSGASPVIEYAAQAPDVVTLARGEEIADGLLEQLDQDPRDVSIVTLEAGLLAGQELEIDRPDFSCTGTFFVNAVTLTPDGEEWVYQAEASEAAAFQGSELEQWRQLTGGGSGTPTVSTGGGGGGGGGGTSGTSLPLFIGGSRVSSRDPNPAAWSHAQDYVHFVAATSFTGLLRVHLWAANAGVSATARLWDVTAGSAAMTTTSVTSQTPTERTVTGAIIAGHTYRLEVLNGTNGERVFVIGTLELP